MNNLISIVEIPVTDFSRALKFYGSVLDVTIETTDMSGTQMGVVPAAEGAVNLILVKGPDYNPSATGAIIYLQAGADLQPVLRKVEAAGGKVMLPKTEISPEMGFFALFTDPEGNRLGLHSAN
ncbi:VOC family protein [Pedobacter yulinensis]|uniref:VOC family protein n=2 Tax=Pedobacter yulinensis TaxID=2126353 RepID=A0A2T3HMX3_9SPHI|nr:VOC family protein [Pedobacter yulinensis]